MVSDEIYALFRVNQKERTVSGMKRVMQKRFDFAIWMFSEAALSKAQAELRRRLMVVYMKGESTLLADSTSKRTDLIRLEHALLTARD